jgi:maltose O-acetyltransferase
MMVFKSAFRLYAGLRYWLKGLLPPRRNAFRACGEGVFVHHHVRFEKPEDMTLDGDIYIGPRCELYGHGGIEIGRGTVLGAHVTLIASNHRFEGPELTMLPFDDKSGKTGITIGRGVWIGQNALVLPGVTLGSHSVIAAGSVVTNDVAPGTIHAGVPARLIRVRKMPPEIETLPSWVSAKSKRFHLY